MTDVARRTWNFVLTGEVRSGAGVVLTSINNRGGAVCHADLFHPNPDTRRAAHEAYFGPQADDARMPEWYVEGLTNPWQYVNRTVLDNPLNGETSVGLHIAYPTMRRLELYDLLERRDRDGDFGIVHVVRNPVACFVSLKQAEQSGVWALGRGSAVHPRSPGPVRVDAGELTAFCRENASTECKIRAACADRLEVTYRDLVVDYQAVMAKVFDFVELPEKPELATPGCRRLKNRPFKDRVTNWAEVKATVPTDVRRLIEGDDLF